MKYDKLKVFLKESGQERIQLTFTEIESILSFSLPNSAKQYRAWWANGGQSHSNTWMDAGYKVDEVSFTRQYVVFIRTGPLKDIRVEKKQPIFVRSNSVKEPSHRPNNVSLRGSTVPERKEAVRRITNDAITVNGYKFEFLQELIPECDADGRIKEYRPQENYHKNKPLNPHGSGTFCRFSIHAGNWPGVYLWVVDDEIIYIGETSSLAQRFNTGYGVIQPVNCYVGGQVTNCKMNKVVLKQAKKGQYVKLYFFETEDYKIVELELLRQIKTKYNVKDN